MTYVHGRRAVRHLRLRRQPRGRRRVTVHPPDIQGRRRVHADGQPLGHATGTGDLLEFLRRAGLDPDEHGRAGLHSSLHRPARLPPIGSLEVPRERSGRSGGMPDQTEIVVHPVSPKGGRKVTVHALGVDADLGRADTPGDVSELLRHAGLEDVDGPGAWGGWLREKSLDVLASPPAP
ncbi:hypothetical protein EF912_02335 [Streptomyces sp. WAC07061]|nr:hypothetical protein EF912_02335 [Streptomyces sp. WAC07061]